jgi:RNA polymerase sigma-70 factor (ECF subfamily)
MRATPARRSIDVPMAASNTNGNVHPLDPARLGDHIDRVYRAAWALCGSRERAEDLVQDTFARVLARPRFLRNDDDLGYLLTALRNTFFSQQRSARARLQLVELDELERVEDRASLQPQAVLEARLVFQTIASLPPAFRDALVAVDLVGLSYREAARRLHVREATLTSRLSRARSRVALALEDRAVEPHPIAQLDPVDHRAGRVAARSGEGVALDRTHPEPDALVEAQVADVGGGGRHVDGLDRLRGRQLDRRLHQRPADA